MKQAYNEIFNNKKEKTTDNCYDKDKPQGIMLSEKKPGTEFHLCEMSKKCQSIKKPYKEKYISNCQCWGCEWVLITKGHKGYFGVMKRF